MTNSLAGDIVGAMPFWAVVIEATLLVCVVGIFTAALYFTWQWRKLVKQFNR